MVQLRAIGICFSIALGQAVSFVAQATDLETVWSTFNEVCIETKGDILEAISVAQGHEFGFQGFDRFNGDLKYVVSASGIQIGLLGPTKGGEYSRSTCSVGAALPEVNGDKIVQWIQSQSTFKDLPFDCRYGLLAKEAPELANQKEGRLQCRLNANDEGEFGTQVTFFTDKLSSFF